MKKIISLILVITLCCAMIPQQSFVAIAATTITNPSKASGKTYSEQYAAKLDQIFNGTVNLFSNTNAKFPLGTSLDNSQKYYVAGTIYGWQCYIYAQAVYYYLFGDIPFHGDGYKYWSNSAKVVTNQEAISYNLFISSGVGFGAYMRTTTNSDGSFNGNSGHSMILLSYDTSGLTYLEGNADGNGLVRITTRTWSEFNNHVLASKGRKLSHIVQCKTAACTHSYTSTVTKAATCTTAGSRKYTCSKCNGSYTESIPPTGNHSYGNWTVVVEANCTESGTQKKVCSVCGDVQNGIIAAKGHNYDAWKTKTNASCTQEGLQERYCLSCNDYQTQVIPALEHDFQIRVMDATCSEYEKIQYKCLNCGYTYEEYTADAYSEWSTTKPDGVDESLIETKTQYRYADYEIKTSYEPALSGYDLVSSTWEQTSAGNLDYVKNWPAGYLTSHSLYAQYHKAAKSNTESATEKTEVTSDKIIGYLYYHWCRGTYAYGPINRKISTEKTAEFSTFHSFFSTVNPDTLTSDSDRSYVYANASCCKDSHWYFCIPVYRQSYNSYRKLFTYSRWSDWSDWSDSVVTGTSERKVETRTMYRYRNEELGEHTWNNGVETKAPTCTVAGIWTYTCTVCGETKTESIPVVQHEYQNGYCVSCDKVDPGWVFPAAKLQVGNVSANAGDIVTIPVSISTNPGFAGFTFVFAYDASAMTLTEITKGELLWASESGAFTKNVNGKTLNWVDIANITDNGVLFNLNFKIADNATEGDYAISVALKNGNSTNFVDEKGHAQMITFQSGKVSIAAESETVPETLTIISEPVKTSYKIGESLNTSGLELRLTYSDGTTETITSGYTVSGFSSATAGTKIVTVKYGDLTTTFSVTVNELVVDEDTPQIVVESRTARIGSTVFVTVSLEKNPGIWGMDLVVDYDKSQLTLTNVTNGTVFSAGEWIQGKLSGERYILSYEASGFDNVTGNGILATLEFTVNEDASVDSFSEITLSYHTGDIINVEFQDIYVVIVPGGIQITDYIIGDVNGDGIVNKKDSLLLRMYLADNSIVIDMQAADVYADGVVNKKDSLYLKQFLAGWDVELGA